MSTASNDPTHRPAVLIVDENGPRRQALMRLCEGAGWLVRLVDAPALEERDLESVEREHILRVLMAHGGNVSETARVLGVHRRTLQRKLRLAAESAEVTTPNPVISPPLRSSGAR